MRLHEHTALGHTALGAQSSDTAYLRNGSGTLIDSCKWGSTGSAKYC
jgi:hypothetical protein